MAFDKYDETMDWSADQLAKNLNISHENSLKIIKVTASVAGGVVVSLIVPVVLPGRREGNEKGEEIERAREERAARVRCKGKRFEVRREVRGERRWEAGGEGHERNEVRRIRIFLGVLSFFFNYLNFRNWIYGSRCSGRLYRC
jgi:hypothetical protein